jgi:hypothetical protein
MGSIRRSSILSSERYGMGEESIPEDLIARDEYADSSPFSVLKHSFLLYLMTSTSFSSDSRFE